MTAKLPLTSDVDRPWILQHKVNFVWNREKHCNLSVIIRNKNAIPPSVNAHVPRSIPSRPYKNIKAQWSSVQNMSHRSAKPCLLTVLQTLSRESAPNGSENLVSSHWRIFSERRQVRDVNKSKALEAWQYFFDQNNKVWDILNIFLISIIHLLFIHFDTKDLSLTYLTRSTPWAEGRSCTKPTTLGWVK